LLIALGCTFHAKLVFAGDEGVGEFSSPLRPGTHVIHPNNYDALEAVLIGSVLVVNAH